jgi:MFS superfamily sulfate permease-like transporter
LVAVFLAPVLGDLPQATLGSVVTVSVLGLISFGALARLLRIDRLEFVLALITAITALVFDLLIGVLVGVFLTFYFLLRALNHPVVSELRRPQGSDEFFMARPEDPQTPGMLILRIDSGLYTMNVRRVQDEIYRRFEEAPDPRVVVLDVGATVDTSVTVIDALLEVDQHLGGHGAELWIASIPPRALAKTERTPLYHQWVKAGRIHPSVLAAVRAFEG